MNYESYLKQIAEKIKEQAEVWNIEYDNTMTEQMWDDVIEILRDLGFKVIEKYETKRYYELTEYGLVEIWDLECEENLLDHLKSSGYELYTSVEGFYIENLYSDLYEIYYRYEERFKRLYVIIVCKRDYYNDSFPNIYDFVCLAHIDLP